METWLPSLVDRDALVRPAKEDAEVSRRHLEMMLWNAFDVEPLEDGITHPAEQILNEAVQNFDKALDWLEGIAVDAASPAFAASVLRCLGRLRDLGTVAWRENLVRGALSSPDIQMRDAGLQAAETWGGAAMREALEAHLSFESAPWLREAMSDVIEDLRD